MLMLRPERLQMLDGVAPGDVNVLRGRVIGLVYQGESVLLRVELADGTSIPVRGSSTRGAMAVIPQPGEPVMLGLAAEDTLLLPPESSGR
jgi:putative spermidine/putrescine transport system ATP-binding protein